MLKQLLAEELETRRKAEVRCQEKNELLNRAYRLLTDIDLTKLVLKGVGGCDAPVEEDRLEWHPALAGPNDNQQAQLHFPLYSSQRPVVVLEVKYDTDRSVFTYLVYCSRHASTRRLLPEEFPADCAEQAVAAFLKIIIAECTDASVAAYLAELDEDSVTARPVVAEPSGEAGVLYEPRAIVFEISGGVDHRYIVRASYLKEPHEQSALVEIFDNGTRVHSYLYPAYRIWNVHAHVDEIIAKWEGCGKLGFSEGGVWYEVTTRVCG